MDRDMILGLMLIGLGGLLVTAAVLGSLIAYDRHRANGVQRTQVGNASTSGWTSSALSSTAPRSLFGGSLHTDRGN